MVEIQLSDVQRLQSLAANTSKPHAERALEIRRFCFLHKASAPIPDRAPDDSSLWTKVDTEHLLEISSNMHAVSNYLIERVVAAG